MLSVIWSETSASIDLTPLVQPGVRFSTGRHGCVEAALTIRASVEWSFYYYNRPGLPRLVIGDGATLAFVGRVEDVALVAGGVRIRALGYWRALSDTPYTALWSTKTVRDWRVLLTSDVATSFPDRYAFDTNNRIYITAQKGAVQGNTTVLKIGIIGFIAPSKGARLITTVSFSYSFTGQANWYCGMQSNDGAWGVGATPEWSLTGAGAVQSGSATVTLAAPRDRIYFILFLGAADAANAAETGTINLTITDIRIKTTTAAGVYADAIAAGLASYVNGINAGQLSSSAALIESPAVDLTDEVYEDQSPADILDRLALLGDNATPPNLWETGVTVDQQLYFRQRAGNASRRWYLDAANLPEIERTLEALANSTYAVYQDANGTTQRSAAGTDADSIAANGLTRSKAVAARTTSATEAGVVRDAALADGKSPLPRASIKAGPVIYDQAGAPAPAYLVASGDQVTVRNLPPTAGAAIDRVRTFRVAETTWTDGAELPLELVPESPLPALDLLTARNAAGLR